MAHDERENQKAAERLIPGALALTKEAMPPAQQQAARIEKDVEASALGRELMQPMPAGWGRSLYELRNGDWEVVTTHAKHFNNDGITNRADFIANARATTLTEAHRLCREQAWAKHRKNEEARNA